MAVSPALKNRIRSTKNIKQITRAMEAVSAVKMRKSEQAALQARPFALAALQILRNVAAGLEADYAALSPLLEKRIVNKTTLVVVTSDKGLAGSFNTNILREAEKFLKEATGEIEIVTIGKKARDFFAKRPHPIVSRFQDTGDFVELDETRPIATLLEEHYMHKKTDRIVILYTNFLSVLKQEVTYRELLPFSVEMLESIIEGIIPFRGRYAGIPNFLGEKTENIPYLFEPTPAAVLARILPKLLHVEVHQAILEANASEHSSRMVAMKNASENAGELIEELTLAYNKVRQAAITKELTEITAGAAAMDK